MNKNEWEQEIKKCLQEAGTYDVAFKLPIEILAGVLEKRDRIEEINLEVYDGEPVIVFADKDGQMQIKKNPCLTEWNSLNDMAMKHWRELGLTPKAQKTITEGKVKTQAKKSKLERVLDELEQ